ncbi:MFS transporter [Mycobacterium heckeshornense]|uniref:Lysosomal dipeptide transporter MFSD1 n=1 Tax=Mycobacterium heckeshornense TaxID=110505 RepID=A0A2G8B879_9MYCO|nr:MFS transporter [Mycobacterium heckeshornense]BCO37347.1 MFS transporter [Mycobacterium heckeshornense]
MRRQRRTRDSPAVPTSRRMLTPLSGPAETRLSPFATLKQRTPLPRNSQARAIERLRIQPLGMWTIGAVVFTVAAGYRSALAVAGDDAASRFGVSATQLASFVTLQVIVYLVLLVPAGALIDRFGPKCILCCGLATMSVAQLFFAVTHSFPCALATRGLFSAGDVVISSSVLRLIASWFPGKRNALMSQMATAVGIGFGSVLGAAPLSTALRTFGWSATFFGTAMIGASLIVVVLTALRDHPFDDARAGRSWQQRSADVTVGNCNAMRRLSALREAWREPGTRLGFWVHFTCRFPANAFLLLWGFPFLTRGERFTAATALHLLTIVAVSRVVLGPVIGHSISRSGRARLLIALGIPMANLLTWSATLAWPGQAPLWLVAVLAVVLGAGDPGALIGMEHARLHNPDHRLGAALSTVNTGGACATAIAVLGVGYLVDALEPATADTTTAFRVAFVLYLPMLSVGLWKVIRWHRALHRARSTCRHPARRRRPITVPCSLRRNHHNVTASAKPSPHGSHRELSLGALRSAHRPFSGVDEMSRSASAEAPAASEVCATGSASRTP